MESVENSENRFKLKILNWNYIYGKTYNLVIPAWTMSKYGNLPMDNPVNFNLNTSNFLETVEIVQNIKSETWAIIDTEIYSNSSNIPNKNLFFKLSFDTDINLDKWQFYFSDKSWKNLVSNVKYWIEEVFENDRYIEKQSKKIIILTLSGDLTNDTSYTLTVLKRANSNLEKDEVYNFHTAPKFVLSDFKYLDNTRACVYFNNNLQGYWEWQYYFYDTKIDVNQKLISTKPTSVFRWISLDMPKNYNKPDILQNCEKKTGLKAYIVNLRLDPNMDYEVNFNAWMVDEFHNKLEKSNTFKVRSWNIKSEDKYVYSSFTKTSNVIPSDLAQVIDLQTINTSTLDVEICEGF